MPGYLRATIARIATGIQAGKISVTVHRIVTDKTYFSGATVYETLEKALASKPVKKAKEVINTVQ